MSNEYTFLINIKRIKIAKKRVYAHKNKGIRLNNGLKIIRFLNLSWFLVNRVTLVIVILHNICTSNAGLSCAGKMHASEEKYLKIKPNNEGIQTYTYTVSQPQYNKIIETTNCFLSVYWFI